MGFLGSTLAESGQVKSVPDGQKTPQVQTHPFSRIGSLTHIQWEQQL